MRNEITANQLKEIEQARKKNKNKKVENRLKALELHAKGESREKTAEKTGYSKTYISELVSKYVTKGIHAIIDNHYQGNNRNLSFKEEASILEGFKKAAEAGQVIEVSEIKRAYEEAIGRTLDKDHGQIYRVLARHGWRKVKPRGKHPNKASDEEIDASKKLTIPSERVWKIMPLIEKSD